MAQEAAGGQDVRIGGGVSVVRAFLAERLVDHVHLVQVPIVLGRGVHVVAAEAGTVDAAWHRVKARDDVEVLQELHDSEYGSHEFSVRDRDGNLWTVGTYRGA